MKAAVLTLPTEAMLRTQNHPQNPEEFSRPLLQTLTYHQVTSDVEITVAPDHVLCVFRFICCHKTLRPFVHVLSPHDSRTCWVQGPHRWLPVRSWSIVCSKLVSASLSRDSGSPCYALAASQEKTLGHSLS